MADHTLLHGVQAALDRRLRNRALDLQAQGMQMQDEDRDQRERDMQRRIIDQHNFKSAKLAADAGKPDPNAWRDGWQAAITQRELEQERIRQAGVVKKEDTKGGWGLKKQDKVNEGNLDVQGLRNEGVADTNDSRDYSAELRLEGVFDTNRSKEGDARYKSHRPLAPRGGGGGGLDLQSMSFEKLLDLKRKASEAKDKMLGAKSKSDQEAAIFNVGPSSFTPTETAQFLVDVTTEINRRQGKTSETPPPVGTTGRRSTRPR